MQFDLTEHGLLVPTGCLQPSVSRYTPNVSLPPHIVFPNDEEKSVREELLSVIALLDRDELFKACAALNLVLADREFTKKRLFQYILKQFFQDLETGRILAFLSSEGFDHNNLVIFSRAHVLELLRWVARFGQSQPANVIIFNTRKGRNLFARALLLAGKLWSDRLFNHWEKLNFDCDKQRWSQANTIRTSLATTSIGIHPYIASGRFNELIENGYFKSSPVARKAFELKTGLLVNDYSKCCFALIAQYLVTAAKALREEFQEANVIPYLKLRDDFPQMSSAMEAFFRYMTQSVSSFSDAAWAGLTEGHEEDHPYILRALRNKPILRLNADMAIICDPATFLEVATIGPMFAVTDKDKFARFGDVFEMYTSRIFREVYGESPLSNFYADLRERRDTTVQIADAYLDYHDLGIILETKAIFLNEEELQDATGNAAFLRLLRERYGISEENGKTSLKGVAQLARSIKNWIAGTWIPVEEKLVCPPQTIIPVLLVYDELLGAPLTSEFLANEFDQILAPDKKVGPYLVLGTRKIHRLVVISVEDLENLEVSLRHFSLRKVVEAYSTAHPDRIMPFENFVAESGEFWFSPASYAAGQGLQIGQDTISAFWPNSLSNHNQTEESRDQDSNF